MWKPQLCRDLGIDLPILNAGMGGGTAGPELAAAVSNAGGLGVLGMGGLPPPIIREEIRRLRSLTKKPFGVNIILALLEEGQVEICVDEKVPLLILFWGDPKAVRRQGAGDRNAAGDPVRLRGRGESGRRRGCRRSDDPGGGGRRTREGHDGAFDRATRGGRRREAAAGDRRRRRRRRTRARSRPPARCPGGFDRHALSLQPRIGGASCLQGAHRTSQGRRHGAHAAVRRRLARRRTPRASQQGVRRVGGRGVAA